MIYHFFDLRKKLLEVKREKQSSRITNTYIGRRKRKNAEVKSEADKT